MDIGDCDYLDGLARVDPKSQEKLEGNRVIDLPVRPE